MSGTQCDKCRITKPEGTTGWISGWVTRDMTPFNRCPRCVTLGLLDDQKEQITRIVKAHVSNPIESAIVADYIRDLSIME